MSENMEPKPEHSNASEHQREEKLVRQIAAELNLSPNVVQNTVRLMDDGNTIPFIARYRKEATGEMDENRLRNIEERLKYLRSLEERKHEVLRLIDEQGKLTEALTESIMNAEKMQEVEDLYRPYRQKRKTRAVIAREKGLEPLAKWILNQKRQGDLLQEAAAFVNAETGVNDAEEAVRGAMDILAEMIADDAGVRAWVRKTTRDQAHILTEAKDDQVDSVYEMYYDYSEPVRKLPPHRILAINRGERENVLKVRLETEPERIFAFIASRYIRGASVVKEVLEQVVEDAYKRLIAPAIEREIRNELTERAEEHAIEIFAGNLRNLLLQPPVRGRTVIGVDPAYRTGCKLAVVDETGKLLEVAVIFPTPPRSQVQEAEQKLSEMILKYDSNLIAIGNGTASRETEMFVAALIRKMKDRQIKYVIVNEAGASVYSASKLAQEEFPDLDVAERSAVSIARRLQDPLSELVKIDPKAIGVGQYQHDVSQKRLGESLNAVVVSAVNHVGVDLNTASASLLSYVSGINSTTARNIVKYREEKGSFTNREQLKDVPRLGAKTFEQSAGFLRIAAGDNPLDRTPIHPESYPAVHRLFAELGDSFETIGSDDLKQKLQKWDTEQLAERIGIGVPTMTDILDSLNRPGRDPRDQLPPPIFHTDVLELEDLKPGMELKGTVRNVLDFGAFVDIGVKNDGLVHISELSDQYVRHPMDVVSVGDTVTVRVISVDEKKGRVSLTMKSGGLATKRAD